MIDLELRVEHEDWQQIKRLHSVVNKAVAAGASIAGRAGEVALLLTDDAEMKTLNSQFRGKDAPTDVLAFPADVRDAPFLGDIAIGYQISAADAVAGGKVLGDHLSHLVIHGYLHLVGFDHIEDADAKEMEDLERRALASLGITDPYSPK